jgi:hypothetical protein
VNANIPRFRCWVRDRYLHGLDDRSGATEGVAFGVASVPGRAVGFHVLLRNGAQVGRLPPSALALRPDAPERPTHDLELWNAFAYGVEVIEYDFLQAMRCEVALRSGEKVPGAYMFTLDWHGSPDAEDVGELGWKCGHVIALDDGTLAVQPNNRIRWAETSFVDLSAEWPPAYQTIDYLHRCEQHGRWTIDDDRMFFATKEASDA